MPSLQYLIIDTSHPDRLAAAVDPVDPDAIIRAAESEGARIISVLTTHNHWDHAGGNNKMVQLLGKQLEAVFGGRGDGAEGVTAEVDDASELRIGSLPVQVMFTVCPIGAIASRAPAGSTDRRH
jgi:hydroxyacylglutathione hydrolase